MLFFFGSGEENALALGRQLEVHVSMTFMQHMNNKCLPEALYSEHQYAEVSGLIEMFF